MAKQLNSEQRYVIYLDLQSKLTKKSIAQKIGVHPSTITREVKRNANRDNQYVFCVAQEKCQKRKHNPYLITARMTFCGGVITKGLHIKGKDDVIIYFADAYSSWQKGCVENTNKFIRRYIPKHIDFNLVSPQKIMNIQKKLNNRPREN